MGNCVPATGCQGRQIWPRSSVCPATRSERHDIEFHHELDEASGNSVLCSLIDSLADPTNRAGIWRGPAEQGAQHRTIAEHRGIIAAIERGDGQLAQALMLVHISGVEQWLQRVRLPKGDR